MAAGLALTLIGSGCKHSPQRVTHIPGRAPERGINDIGSGNPLDSGGGLNGNNGGGLNSTGIAANPAGSHAGWNRNESALSAHTVHFAYDSSAIKSSEQANVAAVADYLKSNAGAAVEVQGHCDERGTDEYNRSLGERRALAIREALVALGVEAARVDTVSFGRDKPVDLGHSEASHAKNRRGEFVVLTAP
ncbi:MAG: OmpA family protein [Verrucomicrobiota bacterium]